MFVLPVELDQPRRQILERTSGRQLAVHERATPALLGDLAADQQFFPAAFKNGFDGCAVFAGADEVAGRPTAKEKPDRFHEDGFTGPGLACEDVQAGLELDLNRVDDCQPPDAKEPEHRKEGNSNPNIGLTAFSQHATVLHTSY